MSIHVSLTTPWLLVRKRNTPAKRPPLVGEFLVLTFADRDVSRGQSGGNTTAANLSCLDWSRTREWVHSIPDTLLLGKLSVPGIEPGTSICSQELWPLDQRGGHMYAYKLNLYKYYYERRGSATNKTQIPECLLNLFAYITITTFSMTAFN
jgi:hypothetical protein